MSSSLRQRKLEQQRERQLSRQQQRRQNMTSSMSQSTIVSEEVEYIHAYDNPGHAIDEISSNNNNNSKGDAPRAKKGGAKKKKAQPQVSKLIDLLDDDDDLHINTSDVSKPSRIENTSKTTDERHGDDSSTPTPRNSDTVQKNEDLFNLSDASSESNYSQRQDDNVSLAGAGIRPQTAQSNYQQQLDESFNTMHRAPRLHL